MHTEDNRRCADARIDPNRICFEIQFSVAWQLL